MSDEGDTAERIVAHDDVLGKTAPRPRVVGIGAPTTRLDTLTRLLDRLPADTGFAFIIVLHGEPSRDALHIDVLKRHTPMTVMHASSGVFVEPNTMYLITPEKHLTILHGILHSTTALTPQELLLPIDSFFRSLAKDQGDRAIGILLAGIDADGVLGLESIKEHGGLTLSTASLLDAAHEWSIHLSSDPIADLVGTPEEIATKLMNYAARLAQTTTDEAHFHNLHGETLQKILNRLQQRMGHDFSGYKNNTIIRRIIRRMTLSQVGSVDDYVRLLDSDAAEVEALFRELLIGVTSFFRDPEAFACLDHLVLRQLCARREPNNPIRVWVPGCSTGEETYSLAIMLHERALRHQKPLQFQIFATDIDSRALDKARKGRYPRSISADVDPGRFRQFFTAERNELTVAIDRQIRDSVVFAAHNVFKDPPFSKLDLICCRNLMIYFGPELQNKILPIFHYALRPDGYLFLGKSETIGDSQRFFRPLDHKWKIFQRQEVAPKTSAVVAIQKSERSKPKPSATIALDKPINLRELTEQILLAEYTPTSIVVNEDGDMLYIHGRTGNFLEPTTGEVSTNLLKVAREGLRIPLATAVHNVKTHQKPYQCDTITVRHEQGMIRVRLTAAPIVKSAPASRLIIITLTELSPPPESAPKDEIIDLSSAEARRINELAHELQSTREYLYATIEQLGQTNEEFRSANDELQSSNEEFQSINEALQTSKEELQSVNEELSTLNTELHHKIDELTNAQSDIKHLLDNARVGMIFLDAKLRIRRFTLAATDVVDLIVADIGRPLAQFIHRLRYDHLHEDTRRVLQTREPLEMELQTHDARWFLVRILPYRTTADAVDGVVLTFTDVTQLKESNDKLEFLFDVLPVGIAVLDHNRQPLKYNAAFLRMSDLTAAEFVNGTYKARRYFRADGSLRELEEFSVSRILAGEASALDVETGFARRDGKFTWLAASSVSCKFADWRIVSVTSDTTARKEAEFALHASEEKFSKAFHLAPLMIGIFDLETLTLVECNQRFLEVSGYTRDEAIGASTLKLGWLSPDTASKLLAIMADCGYVRNEEIVCRAKNGREIDCLYHGFIMSVGGKRQVVSMVQDISERKRSEESIKATLRQEKETVLRELAHRTKNNMFVIRSMLNLHAMHSQNEEVQRLFADVENKIVAMALVHQKLYQSKNLSRLDLGEYLRELAPALASSHSLTPERIVVHIDAEEISALIDTAIPCGLVVTELVTNAFKHAFPAGRVGNIFIRLRRKAPHTIQLEVRDDGIGLGHEFDARHQTTLGLQTIFMIVEHQLKGTVAFHASPQGLACHIEFADTLYSERV
ncbi:MAG TPA: CheR family methyltransferase [Polyangium sp.]|nr:CheR family methyltransferase [Polyangium sp.]